FASGEDGAAVGSWQDSGFDPDVADFAEGAGIGAALLIDYLLAEDAFAPGLIIARELGLRFVVVFRQPWRRFLLDVFHQSVAFCFGMFLGVERVGQVGADPLVQIVVVRLIELRRLNFALRAADFVAPLAERGANLLDLGVAEFDRVAHRLFFYFFRA